MSAKVKMIVTHPKGFRQTVNGTHKLFNKGEAVEVSPHVAKRFADRLKSPSVIAAEAAAAKAAVEAATIVTEGNSSGGKDGEGDDDKGKSKGEQTGGGDPKSQGAQGQQPGQQSAKAK